jgi:hypothetical protein
MGRVKNKVRPKGRSVPGTGYNLPGHRRRQISCAFESEVFDEIRKIAERNNWPFVRVVRILVTAGLKSIKGDD